MYKVTRNGDNTQSDVVEITVDTLVEMQEVPTTFGVGSDCIVLENTSVWRLGNDKKWHQI